MTRDTDLSLLRDLDVAPRVDLDGAARARAAERLRMILSAPTFEDQGRSLKGAPKRRSHVPRWATITTAAAAAVTVAGVMPNLFGADSNAYASWTPVAQQSSADDRALADAACRDAGLDLDSPELAIAERRGQWIALLYTSADPTVATCMARLPIGSDDVGDVDLASAGGQGAVPVSGQFTQGPVFEYGGGGLFGTGDRPTISLTLGDVGDQVAEVTIHTAAGEDVVATVADGRYVAWWPGHAFPTDFDEPSGRGGPAPTFTYSITLEDGTVIEDAQFTSPP